MSLILPDKPWPADSVERWPVARLIPHARNARIHSDAQIDQLAASIREWGWTMPVLCDETGGIIAGHGRVLAALRLGIEAVPVMIARGWTEAQRRAYVIADNKLAENASWDFDMLRNELTPESLGGLLPLTGFAPAEIDMLRAPDTDAAAEWQGMPDYDQPDQMPFRSIVVHCRDAAAVQRFLALVGQSVTDKTRWLWFPAMERQKNADLRYVGRAA